MAALANSLSICGRTDGNPATVYGLPVYWLDQAFRLLAVCSRSVRRSVAPDNSFHGDGPTAKQSKIQFLKLFVVFVVFHNVYIFHSLWLHINQFRIYGDTQSKCTESLVSQLLEHIKQKLSLKPRSWLFKIRETNTKLKEQRKQFSKFLK